MSKSVLAACLLAALALPASAQTVKVTRTDGRTVQGELLGFEQGRYRLRLADGTLEEIDETRVREVVLVSPAAPVPDGAEASAAAAARDAFERGDFDLALQRIGLALKDLDADRALLHSLAGRVSAAYVERLLEKRDAAGLADGLRRLLPTLSVDERRPLLSRLAERCADLHKTAPDAAFTASFAELLARLADEGTVAPDLRASLAELFVRRGDAEAEQTRLATAVVFWRGALRVDPARRDALRPKLIDGTLAVARGLLETRDPSGARDAAREALSLDHASGEAKQLMEDAEFAALRQDFESDFGGPDGVQALRTFLARTPREDQRVWAEQALTKALAQNDPRLPGVSAQIRRYFPVRPGRWMLYRRGDGEMQERIRCDAAVREGDVLRVYHTLQEIYRDYATSKAYVVEIERDAVLLPLGGDREPLLRFPARAGDVWTWRGKEREFRRTVKGLGEAVSVGPEGRRTSYADCLVVDFTSTVEREGVPVSITSRSSYAPGVGLVKLEFLEPEFRKFNLELAESGTAP